MSFVPPVVFRDLRWHQCIRMALQSKSKDQRYGAVLVLPTGANGGRGRNRRLGRDEPCPFKTSFFLHAEADAIRSALITLGREKVRGSTVYIAGFLPPERRPLIRRLHMIDRGSCLSCATLYVRYDLSVAVMTEYGWEVLPPERALWNAKCNKTRDSRNGMTRREFRRFISL